jgi:phosphoenolpyruvate phosphomutase
MGFLKVSAAGAMVVRDLLARLLDDAEARRTADMGSLLRALIGDGHRIRVLYTTGNWIDVDSMKDALDAGNFR